VAHLFVPEIRGGALYGQPGFSPQTGLVYTPGIDRLIAYGAVSVGATLANMPGASSFAGGLFVGIPHQELGTTTAYDPATGEMVWQAHLPGQAQAGLLVTAGNLVFQGDGAGFLHAFNATTGEERFNIFTGNRVHAAPMTYAVNGKQYVTVAAGDVILTFALLGQ
jgi:glucose dehydrogenase